MGAENLDHNVSTACGATTVPDYPSDPAGPVSSPLPRVPTYTNGVAKEQPEAVEDIVN